MTFSPKVIAQTPCWIITLDASSDNVRSLLSALATQGVSALTVPGVDGRKGMPVLEGNERLAPWSTRWRHLCELTSSEVGCYLAHLRALRTAYESGIERICIMEDDVQLEPSFATVLAELEILPEDVEMVRLMGLKIRKRKTVSMLADGRHQLVRPERGELGAQGYLINRTGMAKILGYGSTIFEPIDKLFDHFWEYDLRLYGVEPHVLLETVHASNIIKSNVAKARVPLWLHWIYPVGKLLRSVKRHAYLLRHRGEFYPAEMPIGKPGRSARLR